MADREHASIGFDDDEIVRVVSPQIHSLAICDEEYSDASSVLPLEKDDSEEQELKREDIQEAQALPGETRKALNFSSKEKLTAASEKVRARPALDMEINEKLERFNSLLENPAFEQFHEVLNKGLVNTKDGMVKAELGGASLKRSNEVLDQVLGCAEQSCNMSTENFELSSDTSQHLAGFELLEQQRVTSLRKYNMDDAEQLQLECIKLLDDATAASQKNVDKIVQKKREVENEQFLAQLHHHLEEVEQTVQDEIQFLHMTVDNCQSDIEITKRSQLLLKERREMALFKYDTKDKELVEEIKNNEDQQEELRKQLAKLEEKRMDLIADKNKRTDIQRYADQEQTRVAEELERMKQDFEALAKQTRASLEVMLLISETSDIILKKCIEFQSGYEQRLLELDIMALSQQREALAQRAVTCKLQMDNSEENISYLREMVKSLEKEMRTLAMNNLKAEVKKKQDDKKGYKRQISEYQRSKAMNESKYIGINLELKEIDARLVGLGQALQSIEDMAADRHTRMQAAFNTEDPYGSLTSDTESI